MKHSFSITRGQTNPKQKRIRINWFFGETFTGSHVYHGLFER
jgi:hypothetical protein